MILFFYQVVKGPYKPILEITDFFMRLEFASRGSVHIHRFAYMKDALQYGEVGNETVAGFYDKIIFCSSDIKEEHKKCLENQLHIHPITCYFDNTHQCRFTFPMPHTVILEPLDVDSENEHKLYKEKWNKILRHLKNYGMGQDVQIVFN